MLLRTLQLRKGEEMINFHELTREQKEALKPLVNEVRKHLYQDTTHKELIQNGLVVNFGKGEEQRHTLKLAIVA